MNNVSSEVNVFYSQITKDHEVYFLELRGHINASILREHISVLFIPRLNADSFIDAN